MSKRIDGAAAARWLLDLGTLALHGYCLHYVWRAYDAQGADTNLSAGTALEAWYLSDGKHHGDWNPPAGVPVWFGAKPGSSAGDVVISLGGGRVAATDQPRYGVVGTCTIAERQALIGRPYLGWTESIFDQPIAYNAPAGGRTEDDMFSDDDRALLRRIDAANRNGKKGSHTDGTNTARLKRVEAKVAAQDAAIEALAAANGADPKAILKAVQDGVSKALDGLTLTIDADA